jgi:hypothetical protein
MNNGVLEVIEETAVVNPEFPDFLGKAVVHGQNLDIWEFGKGALSANYIFSATTTRQSERLQTQF